MFEDALKTTGNEGKFVVKKLTKLIREAVPVRLPRVPPYENSGCREQVAALDEDFEFRDDAATSIRIFSSAISTNGRLFAGGSRQDQRGVGRPTTVVAVSVGPRRWMRP